MKKVTLFGLSATLFLAIAVHSQAQVITSVQFNTYGVALNSYGTGYNANLTAGEPSYDVNDWNSYTTVPRAGVPTTLSGGTAAGAYTFPNNTTALISSTGVAQTYGFSITYARGDNTGSTSTGMSSVPFYYSAGESNQALANSGIGTEQSVGADFAPLLTLNLSGLSTTHTYDIVEYVSGLFYASGTDIWSAGTTSYYVNPTNGTGLGSWVQGTSTDPLNPTSANYVQFSNVTTGTGSLSLVGSGNAAALMGFQIIDLGVISAPEPSTWAMMIGGLGVLVLCVRRKGALQK